MLMKKSLSKIDKDMAWDIYTDLNTVITALQQLIKDSKWDQCDEL